MKSILFSTCSLFFRKNNTDSSKRMKKEILLNYCVANKDQLNCGGDKLLNKSFKPLIYLLTCLTESDLVENTQFCCLRVFVVSCHLRDR